MSNHQICTTCHGSGLGIYPNTCYACNGTGVITSNIGSDWLLSMQTDFEEKICNLKVKIDELNQKIEQERSDTHMKFVGVLIDGMTDEDKHRYEKVITSKGLPKVHVQFDNSLVLKWDGLTINELDIKDIIE